MTDETISQQSTQLIDNILSGQSLAVYLEPDENIIEERTTKEYWETYDLPNIKLEAGMFFAYSDPHHAAGGDGIAINDLSSYGYANFSNFFINFSCESRLKGLEGAPVHTLIMSRNRYKTFKFISKDNYSLVWDSAKPTPASNITPCLKQGLKFKIALLDFDDIWHIHAVDLPIFWPEMDAFQMQTHVNLYPAFFSQPKLFNSLFIPKNPLVFDKNTLKPNINIDFEAPAGCSYFSAYSNGEFITAKNRKTGGDAQKYKHFKVFCEKLG